MRIWVRSGTKIIKPPPVFQGPTKVHRTPQEPWRFAETTALSETVEPKEYSTSPSKSISIKETEMPRLSL